MQAPDTLAGTIQRFLFQDIDSGYVVFLLEHREYSGTPITTVRGTFPPLHAGQEVELSGNWVLDPKYGRQFEATVCRGALPTSIMGIKRFLGSGLIKGVGKVYAEKLVTHFGAGVLDIIDKTPQRLLEVGGLGPKRVATITEAWQEHKEIADVMVFLQDKGISPALAARLYKHYRHNTVACIVQNPYRLAEEVWGVGFKTADEIAQKLGFGLDSPQRIMAGILFALTSAMLQGHLYTELQALRKTVYELLALEEHEENALKIKRELHNLYEQEKIKLVTVGEQHFLATSKCYHAEHAVALKMHALLEYPSPLRFDIDALYKGLDRESDALVLNEKQIQSILTVLQHKVTIITGGPGTGKTTLVKKLITVLEQYHVRYKLAAPTGRAAKRIFEGTGKSAATIHRLLEFDPMTRHFKHSETNALPVDFLIIDEASMIDIFLAHALLKAVPVQAHLVFIGDIDQLPAVGAGNFLHDCIASGQMPCIRLTEVFRQAQDSLIILNAHRVNRGEFPQSFVPGSKRDFVIIKELEAQRLPEHLKRVFFGTLAGHNIALDDAIVLTPMNRGAAGTQALNQHLQLLLNPHVADHIVINGITFKVGDRVMQIRNNYDKFVFNGDIGRVESLSHEDRVLTVTFGERPVEYDFTDLNELVLAYAISIHKSQGSEFSAVIIPLFMQHFTLLQRNLLYTAITRAKNLCVLIGESKAIAIALRNNKSIKRVTFLQSFLNKTL